MRHAARRAVRYSLVVVVAVAGSAAVVPSSGADETDAGPAMLIEPAAGLIAEDPFDPAESPEPTEPLEATEGLEAIETLESAESLESSALAAAEQVTVDKEGDKADLKNSGVAGGTVTVRTGVAGKQLSTKESFTNGFSLGFAGKEAPGCRWLQYVWREYIVTKHKDKKVPFPVPGELKVIFGGTMALTTDPAKPSYVIDGGNQRPFTEGVDLTNRDAGSFTSFDAPTSGAGAAKMKEVFAAGATEVVSRAHLVSYLVCRGANENAYTIRYRVQIDIEWTLTKADDDAKATYKVSGDTAKGFDNATMRDVLIRNFPLYKDAIK